MNQPLLSTKLTPPPLRANAVQRPRLSDDLDQGLAGRLTLLSAPAGYGKTTLIRSWVQHTQVPFAWLSLDEKDNDPGRFLAYLLAAFEQVGIEVDYDGYHFLQYPGEAQVETLLAGVINRAAEKMSRFGLVLDDYHHITNQEIHALVTHLLEHLPGGAHLVISTRADPPLPVARLRARGQLTELRARDLRFQVTEGEDFLKRVFNLDLSPQDVRQLVARTDGWPAGLQLASIALGGQSNPRETIKRFSGSHDFVVDFLTAEVLEGQSEDTRSFLLSTAILDRLSAPLCEAVTGRADAHELLRELRHNNLFLEALDDVGCWYAYHQLFRDTLTQQLLELQPELVPHLYLKASAWCQENDQGSEAIEYALAGGHLERAADLIEARAQDTLQQGEVVTFLRWIERLPAEGLDARPMLRIYYAWALLIRSQNPETAAHVLDQVRESDAVTSGRLKAVRSIQAALQRDISGSIALAREALENLPVEETFFRQITAWNLSAALFLSGDQEGGTEMLKEVARISLDQGSQMVAVVTLCRLGNIWTQNGDLHQAYATYQQALEAAAQGRARPMPAACEAYLGLGKIEWEWYRFEDAARNLSAGLALSKRWREVSALEGRITLAYLLTSQGDFEGADHQVAAAQKIAASQIHTETGRAYVDLLETHLKLLQGDLPYAQAWAGSRGLTSVRQGETLEPSSHQGADLVRNLEWLLYAWILVAEGRLAEALQLVVILQPVFQDLGYQVRVIELYVLKGMIQARMGDQAAGLETIQAALALAAPANYRRVFLDSGPELIQALQRIQALGDPTGFAQKILASDAQGEKSGRLPSSPESVEALSPREREILGALVSERSVPEIAADLYISVSTLRTHIRNIYRKLGVHSRYEAVMRGQALGML